MGALFEVEETNAPPTSGQTSGPTSAPTQAPSVDLHQQGGFESHYNCYETPGDYGRCMPLYAAAGVLILGVLGCILSCCFRRREGKGKQEGSSKMTVSGREVEMGRSSAFEGINPMQEERGKERRRSSLRIEGDEEEDGNHFFDQIIDRHVEDKKKKKRESMKR